MSQDFSRKISIVVNKNLAPWQVLNVVANIAAHFGHFLKENYCTGEFFTTKDGISIPRNTQYPTIIFSANREQLNDFVKKIAKENVEKMYSVKEMIETSDDNEIQKSLGQKKFDEVDFLGVGIFGDNPVLKNLTSGLKLWS